MDHNIPKQGFKKTSKVRPRKKRVEKHILCWSFVGPLPPCGASQQDRGGERPVKNQEGGVLLKGAEKRQKAIEVDLILFFVYTKGVY